VVVADHEVEEVGADVLEHGVVEGFLIGVTAAFCEAGDMGFVEDGTAAHALDGLGWAVGLDG
jgi:hypothetical protein